MGRFPMRYFLLAASTIAAVIFGAFPMKIVLSSNITGRFRKVYSSKENLRPSFSVSVEFPRPLRR